MTHQCTVQCDVQPSLPCPLPSLPRPSQCVPLQPSAYCTALHCTALHCTTCTAPYYIVNKCTALHCTTQNSTPQAHARRGGLTIQACRHAEANDEDLS